MPNIGELSWFPPGYSACWTDPVGTYAQYWRVELVSIGDIQPARTDSVGTYAQYWRVELVSIGDIQPVRAVQ